MIIRPSFTVLGGAAIGLVAGAAVYGAVSTSAATSPSLKPARAAAPAAVGHCAPGQNLEDGVCVIHVERTVVVPASPAAEVRTTPRASGVTPGTKPSSGSSASGDDTTQVGDRGADDATEGEKEAPDGNGLDRSAGEAPSDNGSVAPGR